MPVAGSADVTLDEHPRPTTTAADLARLKSVVGPDGSITAGNAAGINDGAAAMLVASAEAVARFGLKPRARILGYAAAGVAPRIMGIGPVPATQKLLRRLNLSIGNFTLIELNEAFAAQALAVRRVSLWDLSASALAEAKSTLADAHTVSVNVSNHDEVIEAVRKTSAAFGNLDILVNCAGITGATAPVHEYPIASWLQVIDVNLNGTFYCCREIVPVMIAAGYGRIVNIASVAGKEGNPNASAYSASKAAVIGLTKSLGKELATSGVLANCITPATFESPILDQLPSSQIDYMRSRIPMGRLGEAAESAAMACWLASEECSFSTAATFDISGGRTTY